MIIGLLSVCIVLLLVLIGLAGLIYKRQTAPETGHLAQRFDLLEKLLEKGQRDGREDLAAFRSEQAVSARGLREEIQGNFQKTAESLVTTLDKIAGAQQELLQNFANQLASTREAGEQNASKLRQEVLNSLNVLKEGLEKRLGENTAQLQQQFESFGRKLADFGNTTQENNRQARAELTNSLKDFNESLGKLTASNEAKSNALKEAVENKLNQIGSDNAKKLDEMRQTVDEKLQGTLEKRLGESFKLVSERLESVHKGLGEMQSLVTGVGDLKRVFNNVKIRGTWGEIQLGNLLEQVLTRDQYESNVQTRPRNGERVEYAIKLPGKDDSDGKCVWLPIDAKFPKEDYERLVDAAEKGDADMVEEAGKKLELRVRSQAKDISTKYIEAPYTTDFGLLYLPTEGLYAEVVRRPGLVDTIQRENRVVVVGPTTLAALLNSLQMGFKTLAIQQRSSEVWKVLGAVKTEFDKFGEIMDKVKKKLDEAGNTLDTASVRTRKIGKHLRSVEALTPAQAPLLLEEIEPGDVEGEPTLELRERI